MERWEVSTQREEQKEHRDPKSEEEEPGERVSEFPNAFTVDYFSRTAQSSNFGVKSPVECCSLKCLLISES